MPNELVITPASREDIIQAILDKHRDSLDHEGKDFQGGMILTSTHPPSQAILDEIRKADVPVLYAPLCSYDAMKMITSFIAKIRTRRCIKSGKSDQACRRICRTLTNSAAIKTYPKKRGSF